MMVFKEGDKIIMKNSCTGSIKGKKYTLGFFNGSLRVINKKGRDGEPDSYGCSCREYWGYIVTTNELNKQIIENYARKTN